MRLLALVTFALLFAACINNSTNGGSSPDAASCGNLAGTWAVGGTCGTDTCVITQNGCATHVACSAGAASYTGTITGDSFSYMGTAATGEPATCTGTLSGNSLTATCTGASGASCSVSGARH